MAEISLAGLKATLRGALITRDDKDAFTAARMRGWNRDLNARVHPLGFAIVSGVRDNRFLKILGGMVTKAQMQRIGEALAPIVG